MNSVSLLDNVTKIKGIGPKRKSILNSRRIFTVEDLLYYFPRKYLDRSKIVKIGQLKVGDTVTVVGTVRDIKFRRTPGKGKYLTSLILFDGSGYIQAVWFGRRNIDKSINLNDQIALSGKITTYKNRIQMENPDFDILSKTDMENTINTGRILPVYPSMGSLGNLFFRKIQKRILDNLSHIPENLPLEIVIEKNLIPREIALREMHFPISKKILNSAKKRFKYEELFLLQTSIADIRFRFKDPKKGRALKSDGKLANKFLKNTGMSLTKSQKKVVNEIVNDLRKKEPMNRLLQGEVGSGKTIVSIISALHAIEAGVQAAFMAPTEVLATQHYQKTKPILDKIRVNSSILVSTTPNKKKETILNHLKEGKINIIFGTHSLIYERIKFKRLGFIVVDEQHRFGTEQRLLLKEKGANPDVLVLSATPIPRTLALTVFGDLDVSVLRERPLAKSIDKQIESVLLSENKRQVAYSYLKKEVDAGRQGFVIVPLIETSQSIEAKALKETFNYLKRFFKDTSIISVVHGRQSSEIKHDSMKKFTTGQSKILLSTTVVEVGIDVPNATVMIIENAERFGLAQLHQLRGRVGRGKHQARVFIISDLPTEESKYRIEAFLDINDGFEIAEKDLILRGEGNLLGFRQSGPSTLRLSRYARDVKLLEEVREDAFKYYQSKSQSDLNIQLLLNLAKKRYNSIEMLLQS